MRKSSLEKGKKWSEVEKEVAFALRGGQVGVLPTDTLYGLVGSAFNIDTVERIYHLRKRDLKKPMIILISSLKDLERFGIFLDKESKEALKKLWPAKLSVVLGCGANGMDYLTRGGKTLAFRMPEDKQLLGLIKKTGPLVAPSANLAGEKPAENYKEAREYFADNVDFYVDAGRIKSKPSTLIELGKGGKIKVLRPGAVKIK